MARPASEAFPSCETTACLRNSSPIAGEAARQASKKVTFTRRAIIRACPRTGRFLSGRGIVTRRQRGENVTDAGKRELKSTCPLLRETRSMSRAKFVPGDAGQTRRLDKMAKLGTFSIA
jgi:hypothetical protein